MKTFKEYKVPSNYAAMMAKKRKKAGTSEFGKSDPKVGDAVSFKWPSSISMSVPQKNRKSGGYVKGIVTKVNGPRAKVKIGNKVYSVSTSELIKEKNESVNEDSKMGKQSDSQLKDLMKKMRDLEKKDPKKPSTQHMIKRIEKEMKKRKLT